MTLTLPDIPLDLDVALRRKAAEQHCSVDQVAVEAMKAGLVLSDHETRQGVKSHLAASIRARFAPMGGVELPESIRESMGEPPDFRE